ncbi:MAG: hypothetical protein JXB10_01375 [Pirellulales bacterium]|nr:hypothetical protein [Pirellulales bacterium]
MSQPILPKDHSPGDDELRQFAEKFGPFEPPEGYSFEPEFKDPPPRTVPSELYQGRHFRKLRRAILGLFTAGVVLLACAPLPIVRIWGLYLLPLQYLPWIAVGLLALSGMGLIRYLLHQGPLVYVKEGVPRVARIAALFLRTKLLVNGVPSVYEYVAVLEHRDPQRGEAVYSADTHEISAHSKDSVSLTYRIGDYVTAVSLPSKSEKPPRLYGFLDLRPNLGVVRSAEAGHGGALTVIFAVGAIGGFLFLMGWNAYAVSKYQPLEMTFQDYVPPFTIGAATLGIGLIVAIAWGVRRERRKFEKRNQQAAAEGGAVELFHRPKVGLFGQGLFLTVLLLVGLPMLGGGTMICWTFSLNALGDSSPPKLRPVRVREMWMTTHNFIFRNYTIEYEFIDDPAKTKQELLSTPWHMASFGQSRSGLAHIRRGLLGWPWVETITPCDPNIRWIPLPKNKR